MIKSYIDNLKSVTYTKIFSSLDILRTFLCSYRNAKSIDDSFSFVWLGSL